jgi:hypothetical protein
MIFFSNLRFILEPNVLECRLFNSNYRSLKCSSLLTFIRDVQVAILAKSVNSKSCLQVPQQVSVSPAKDR